jgi:hypothetical protein
MKPESRALLICDLAFPQADTGSWHLIGLHNQISVPELPATVGSFVVFWSLRNFSGDAMVMVTVRDNVGDVVYAVRGKIPKLETNAIEHAFAFPPFPFKSAGSHVVELHVDNQLLALRSFHVRVV